ncbi:hypothetical protein [Massilia sp. AB1]|uniref:hypothetical protein n=1 Tax=Massilia sp. AB1 TaxID=2823371 RepID=UPI001B81D868|nr:hypothetical protein [Massilia sp. AB1]MBQ5939785.1 hypothetical protein [Massilia sp. AB1]
MKEKKTIAVPRDGEEIVGNVNATVGGASYTAAFHVPSYVAPKPPRLCGSGSRRIEAKNGDGAAAQLLIPPSDCDRQIRVGGVAGAVYETPGDPWVKVSMDTGDGTAPAQAQNGVAASGITYASVTRELFLRAGEERRITVKHENFRARAAETSAWAEVPTPESRDCGLDARGITFAPASRRSGHLFPLTGIAALPVARPIAGSTACRTVGMELLILPVSSNAPAYGRRLAADG